MGKKFKPPKEDEFIKKISIALGILFVLIIVGSSIHYYSEGSHDASGENQVGIKNSVLYTISLITHSDIEEVHENILYLIISLLGYVTQFYFLYVILDFMIEGKLKNVFSEVKMLNQINKMNNHFIVCGGGRVGKNVANELQKYNMPYVIVESDKDRVERLKKEGYNIVTGDALDENDLEKVGLKRAGYLTACLSEDGGNILLVLTAKEHNPGIKIAARATREKTINKLKHAGAHHIILPELIGGLQMAHAVIKDELAIRNKA